MRFNSRGFTLIELIIGIVVLSISLSIVSTLIAPAEQQSADQIHQIKAAELGQSILDEILGRAFDENSDMAGSIWRCDEIGQTVCSAVSNFGSNKDTGEATRDLFDDVDDYHEFTEHVTATGGALDSGYDSFGILVDVQYKGTEIDLATDRLAKRITVTITTPLGTDIAFTGYKGNF